jgi:L-rhamnose-H+ transport protein
VPHLFSVYEQTGRGVFVVMLGLGTAWGVAQTLFGLAVDAIGITLAFAIVLGISVAVGTLVPLVRIDPELVLKGKGLGVIVAVALVVTGIVMCAMAGGRRANAQNELLPASGTSFRRGLMLAVSSGFGAAMVNLGLAFGDVLREAARRNGAHPFWAPNAIWLPLLLAGSLPNILYCFHLLKKNRTFHGYAAPARKHYFWYPVIMAVCWFSSVTLYGIASGLLGSWGTIVGWPLFTASMMISAGVLGFVTGEWKASQREPLRLQFGGMLTIVAGVCLLSAVSHYA